MIELFPEKMYGSRIFIGVWNKGGCDQTLTLLLRRLPNRLIFMPQNKGG